MNNIVKPVACKILEVKRESLHEYTFKVATDIKPEHGQMRFSRSSLAIPYSFAALTEKAGR